ncbi:MAG: threonine--tRNA ligase, partial [Oscillospiraceae bacterium]
MIQITLKDGSVRQEAAGITAAEAAKNIGMGLYKSACAARVNGQEVDLRTPLTQDCSLEICTFADKFGRHAFWHSASHILAQAVLRLYPNAKIAIGPAIENGFYYDFDVTPPFTNDNLAAIEAEMKKIVKEALPIERLEVSPAEAEALFKDQPYKLELLQKHAEAGEKISLYRQGEFTDLCAGPHLMDTSPVKAFKLTSATGAYWHGDSTKPMLSRVYGTAYPKQAELDAYLTMVEEARKRDHNKIGRELEYFTTVDVIGQGLPLLMPNGAKVFQLLSRWIEDEDEKRGYLLTRTPSMAKSDLYKISGHWDHYREGMFVLGDEEKDKEVFALRPMTCPFQYQIYLSRKRSYRDLPLRYSETSPLFRNEDSGEMHGLIRVRQFTLADGHIVARPDQVEQEFRDCLSESKYILETLGLAEDVSYRFSKWDPNNKSKYEGTPEQWEETQDTMRRILDHLGLTYVEAEGEAAFYGPKLDIQIRNVYGKEDTMITIQIDMLVAKRYGMAYTDSDGSDKIPCIIHRSSIGCYERTIALLLEKYAGARPTWLMPTQVTLVPIG